MPFRDVPEPDKRSILTMALAEYCRENGIDPASRQYDDARELMIIIYQNGVGGGGSRGYPSGTVGCLRPRRQSVPLVDNRRDLLTASPVRYEMRRGACHARPTAQV